MEKADILVGDSETAFENIGQVIRCRVSFVVKGAIDGRRRDFVSLTVKRGNKKGIKGESRKVVFSALDVDFSYNTIMGFCNISVITEVVSLNSVAKAVRYHMVVCSTNVNWCLSRNV